MKYNYYGDINLVIYRANNKSVEIYNFTTRTWGKILNRDDNNPITEGMLATCYDKIDTGELLLELL